MCSPHKVTLSVALAVGLSLAWPLHARTDQTRIRIGAQVVPPTGESEDLIDFPTDFTGLVSAKVNREFLDLGGPSCDFTDISFGGAAYSTATKAFVHDTGCLAEINLPTFTTQANPSNLNEATMAQTWVNCCYAAFASAIDPSSTMSGTPLGGILKYGSGLLLSDHGYYDSNNIATVSMVVTSTTTLSSITMPTVRAVSISGLSTGGTGNEQGFVSSYAFPIPAALQDDFGGDTIVGGQCMPVIIRTSNGPSMVIINASDIGVTSPVPGTNLLNYQDTTSTNVMGAYAGASALWGGTSCISGGAFINLRTVLFVGTNGMGTWCYGNATEGVPAPCDDPEDQVTQGGHAFPYRYQYWAYDVNDLLLVKAGKLQPYEVKPYDYGEISFPYTQLKTKMPMMWWDATNKYLYMMQGHVEPTDTKAFPVIHRMTCTGTGC